MLRGNIFKSKEVEMELLRVGGPVAKYTPKNQLNSRKNI